MPSRQAKLSVGRVKAAERMRKAVELRKTGMTFDAIARELGYSTQGAYNAVKVALQKSLREPTEEMRTLDLNRLDSLLSYIWPLAKKGNLKAIDRIIRILERRAELLGLDLQWEKGKPEPLQTATVNMAVLNGIFSDPSLAPAVDRLIRALEARPSFDGQPIQRGHMATG